MIEEHREPERTQQGESRASLCLLALENHQLLNIQETSLPGVKLLEPRVFGDERGFFVETYRESTLRAAGFEGRFVQDNQSRSRRGILRGLHYQLVQPQAKLIRVARGRIFDVAVDVRKGSPYFGQSFGVELDDEHQRMLFVPAGFAHGFLVLSEVADLTYKCSDYYHPESEHGVAWNDPDLNIQWPDLGSVPMLSAKDAALPTLKNQSHLPAFEP